MLSVLGVVPGLCQQFFVGARVAYGMSAPHSLIGQQKVTVPASGQSLSNVHGNMGVGWQLGIETGLAMSRNFELRFSYEHLFGESQQLEYLDYGGEYLLKEGKAIQGRIIPSVRIKSEAQGLGFWMSSGLIVPLTSESTLRTQMKGVGGNPDHTIEERTLIYRFSPGFRQQLGLSKKIGPAFELDLFLSYDLFRQTAKNSYVQSFQKNGNDAMSQLSVYEQETVFQEDLNDYSNNVALNPNYRTDKAMEDLLYSHDFSVISVGLTLRYRFGDPVE